MKVFKNMTIRTSWSLVLAAFTVLVLLVGGLGGYAVHYSENALAAVKKVQVEEKGTLNKANSEMLSLRLDIQDAHRRLMIGDTLPDYGKLKAEMAQVRSVYDQFFAMDFPPRYQSMAKQLQAGYQKLFDQGLEPQLAALIDGDMGVYNRLTDKVNSLNQAFYTNAEEPYFLATEHEGTALYNDFQGMQFTLKAAIVAAVALSLLIILFVLWGVTTNVIRPLRHVVSHLEQIASGDLSGRIEHGGRAEIGRLFAGLASMQSSLAETVDRVRRSSSSIYTGSQGIAQSNYELSSRTEEQAASLEETAASIEQFTSTVGQNADNAHQASELARGASETAERGGKVVSAAVDTMRTIKTSSQKAVEIIDVVDSIAFQTNILALNASVEAARAGEQGRGFAVVAAEVRTLASRSANAAKEIRELIEASAERVDTGSQLVEQAGSTMGDVVAAVQRVNQLMEEIAAASAEQSNGIGQINQAVNEMDQVTQQNASMVQQASTAANDLERQAQLLREAVSLFRLAEQKEREALPQQTEVGQHESNPAPQTRPAKATPANVVQSPQALTAIDDDNDPEWQTF